MLHGFACPLVYHLETTNPAARPEHARRPGQAYTLHPREDAR